MKKLLLIFLISSTVFAQHRRSLTYQNFSTGAVQNDEYTYYFDPDIAGIVQGEVHDTIARQNVIIMNNEIQAAVTAGDTIFDVPPMDAFFDTWGSKNKVQAHADAIQVPDNFHIKLSSNTIMRRQPSNVSGSAIFSGWAVSNIKISGGHFIGDMREHIYTQYMTVSSPATTTTASVDIEREFVVTTYDIPVTVSDVATNAAEIGAYLDAIEDLHTSVDGDEITIWGEPGVYIILDDASSDTSGINFTGWDDISYGFAIALHGVHNAEIIGQTWEQFHGEGILCGITQLRNPSDGSIPEGEYTCENILIQGCTAKNNRRQGISIVDANGLTIDNCLLEDTGMELWTPPAYGIDLECYRERDGSGNLLEYARVENIVISNCVFKNNFKGDIDLFNPQDVEIYGCTFDYKIDNVTCYNVNIHDNTFNRRVSDYGTGRAVSIGSYTVSASGEQLVNNITIHNNTIDGYEYAIGVGGDDFTVTDNTITNVSKIGISFSELYTGLISGNDISSDEPDTAGIRNFITSNSNADITIDNNTTNMTDGYGIRFNGMDSSTGLTVITNNVFSGGRDDVRVHNSNNITFGSGNTYTTVDQSGNTNVTIP